MPTFVNDCDHWVTRDGGEPTQRVLDRLVGLADELLDGLAISGLDLVPRVGYENSSAQCVCSGGGPARLVKKRVNREPTPQREQASTRQRAEVVRVPILSPLGLQRFGREFRRNRRQNDVDAIAAQHWHDDVVPWGQADVVDKARAGHNCDELPGTCQQLLGVARIAQDDNGGVHDVDAGRCVVRAAATNACTSSRRTSPPIVVMASVRIRSESCFAWSSRPASTMFERSGVRVDASQSSHH